MSAMGDGTTSKGGGNSKEMGNRFSTSPDRVVSVSHGLTKRTQRQADLPADRPSSGESRPVAAISLSSPLALLAMSRHAPEEMGVYAST